MNTFRVRASFTLRSHPSRPRLAGWLALVVALLLALVTRTASAQGGPAPGGYDKDPCESGYTFGDQVNDAGLSAFYGLGGSDDEISRHYASMVGAHEAGYFRTALNSAREVTKLVIKCHPDSPVSRLLAEHNEGVVEAALGSNTVARAHFEALIAWVRSHPGGSQHGPARALLNLGNLERREGNLARARELLQEAEQLTLRGSPPDPNDLAKIQGSLGLLAFELDDQKAARRHLERALELFRGERVARPLFAAMILTNLALVDARDSDFDAAAERLNRALEAREYLHFSSALNAITLNDLAQVERQRGRLLEAEQLIKKALSEWSAEAGENLPVLANMLHTLAQIQRASGNYEVADFTYGRALLTLEGALGTSHPLVAMVLDDRGALAEARGNSEKALADWNRAAKIYELGIAQVLPGASEAQRRGYMALVARQTDMVLASHFRKPSAASLELAARLVLQRKGRSLDVAAASEQNLPTPELESARRELAALAFSGPGPDMTAAEYQKRIERLGDELDKAQRGSNSTSSVPEGIVLEVKRRLLPGELLVDYVRYRTHDPRTGQFGKQRYAALRLSGTEPPELVELADASQIDPLIASYRRHLAGRADLAAESRALFDALLSPLKLGSSQRVLIAPDAELNVIPFEAMQYPSGELLMDRQGLAYLSSGRDLTRAVSKASSAGAFVVFADPAFKAPGEFPRLPGTREEALEIRKLYPAAELVMGKGATSRALGAVHRPSVLHVASHGFFLTAPQDLEMDVTALATRGLVLGKDRPVPVGPTINPLARSGLILAPDAQSARGLVSALELATQDLTGTELVVLSACETGLGDLEDGQGVYGLRRALVLAGSRRQVVSLWKVDDDATRDLMTGFYGALAEGTSTHQALRNAKKRMRASSEHSHPYYWAAFIASGEDGPLPPPAPAKTTPRLSSHGCSCRAATPSITPGWSLLWLLSIAGSVLRFRSRTRAGRRVSGEG